MDSGNTFEPVNIAHALTWLESLVEHTPKIATLSEEERVRLLTATGRLSRPSRDEIRIRNREIKRVRRKESTQADRQARAETGIREARTKTVFQAPLQITGANETSEKHLKSPRNCYVCKVEYTRLHHFYDSMCTSCADLNYAKRFQTATLKGRTALITGSRLKIGYHCTLMMLRAGAKVIATTRFPKDSAIRFAKEHDYHTWAHRLQIHGLDLRHTPSVEIFARFIEQTEERLDILINNAAQTVRRPPGFYAHMMPIESKATSELPKEAQALLASHESCKSQLNALCIQPASEDAASLPAVSWQWARSRCWTSRFGRAVADPLLV